MGNLSIFTRLVVKSLNLKLVPKVLLSRNLKQIRLADF
jgi:hypothetical protein